MNSNFYTEYKSGRILYLYTKLINGETVNNAEEAARFSVNPRSIQRDIEDLRSFFENQLADGASQKQLVYDKSLNCYYLRNKDSEALTNSEILAVCKILLESRSMCKDDMERIIGKIMTDCVPKRSQEVVRSLVANELFHYVEPHHGKHFVDGMWDMAVAVQKHSMLRIKYQKQDGSVVERTVKPVAIMFSEFYFYLTAFIDDIDKAEEFDDPDDIFPTIYRIDRILSFTVLDKHFDIPYKDKFEDGEFRKRIQFMYGGKLRNIKFRYTGANVEAVLDRLPTAKIVEQSENGYVITAEVFGNGIDMWLRSQGQNISIL